ncbi:PREDICTED: CBL-interacting serine/threonine-protein kinase 9 isoform X5 [Ipomoea nil]|uniref:CBL-interacting serine/threonine-protein kinase 9 isoform X5 n=1 Tax=Ipomoea nil TaxID=35883 RepID=UPI000901250F|nr:PREDICTED: CBL-interacting serine/threonine-protein kinase 9 isoform X5 [Ipomoea nil]
MQTQARRMSSTAITFPSSSSIAAVGTPATRTRVGKYELGNTLGEGSFAKVKYATNLDSGESVAIKIIDRDRILRHKMVEGIKREISTMKLIKHPNVLRIFEVLASKTKIYIVLEYANGGELFDKIARHGRLKEDEARGYFQQLINAVDYCHSRGVYHRDLKPENLLLDSFGILKVSDFGLSALPKQVREDGLLHTACGTPNYVAPEVLADKGYNGTSADVWSCGVILFVLMAGYLPFDEPNLTVLYRRIQKASFAFPSWFSSSSKKLIKRILDPNPVTRITIPEILKNDWFKKGYKPPHFQPDEDVTLDDVDAVFNDSEENLVTEMKEKPESMNAFELISRSHGFNLENLFEKQMIKLQGDQTGRKGRLSVATEVFEVAPSLHMVQLRKTGGDTLEFHKFYKNLNSGLKDIVWTTEQSNNEEPKVA